MCERQALLGQHAIETMSKVNVKTVKQTGHGKAVKQKNKKYQD